MAGSRSIVSWIIVCGVWFLVWLEMPFRRWTVGSPCRRYKLGFAEPLKHRNERRVPAYIDISSEIPKT